MSTTGSPRRPLTEGEIALATEVFGDQVAFGPIRIRHGPSANPAVRLAFRSPNTDAITLIGTIFFKDPPVADFSKGGDPDLFLHEMTHVWQYQRLGILPFYWRYLLELDACDFNQPALYHFDRGTTAFHEARLEAQAKMVQEYSAAVRAKNSKAIEKLRHNLAGSGLYGL